MGEGIFKMIKVFIKFVMTVILIMFLVSAFTVNCYIFFMVMQHPDTIDYFENKFDSLGKNSFNGKMLKEMQGFQDVKYFFVGVDYDDEQQKGRES